MKQKFKSVKEKMNKLFQKFAPVKEKAEVFEQKKEEKKHTDTVSKGKIWKKSAKKHASEKEDDWYYDEEDSVPSVTEKHTDEKDTIDHISEEILGFFEDEDK